MIFRGFVNWVENQQEPVSTIPAALTCDRLIALESTKGSKSFREEYSPLLRNP